MHKSALDSADETCASQQSILLEGAHHKLHKSAFENIDKQDFDDLSRTNVSDTERCENVAGSYISYFENKNNVSMHSPGTNKI